jgi:hypothetical protein
LLYPRFFKDILRSHDEIDNEWVAQACGGIYRDIFSFREGQARDNTKSLFAAACHTRDEAFQAAKGEIDMYDGGVSG